MKTIINSFIKVVFITIPLVAILAISALKTPEVMACEEAPQSYDLSVIENWCGSGTERGSIRFVGAEVYTREGDTLTLIDEQDNLWDVEALNIDDNDFLLLWINDNDTDTVEDDTIIKVWREAY